MARSASVSWQTVLVGLRDELVDPWGGVVAGVAGGLAWAVASASTAAVPLGLGVAGAVYGAKVLASALARRAGRDRDQLAGPRPLPAPRRGSPAEQWLSRAQGAVRSLAELVDSSLSLPCYAAVRRAFRVSHSDYRRALRVFQTTLVAEPARGSSAVQDRRSHSEFLEYPPHHIPDMWVRSRHRREGQVHAPLSRSRVAGKVLVLSVRKCAQGRYGVLVHSSQKQVAHAMF